MIVNHWPRCLPNTMSRRVVLGLVIILLAFPLGRSLVRTGDSAQQKHKQTAADDQPATAKPGVSSTKRGLPRTPQQRWSRIAPRLTAADKQRQDSWKEQHRTLSSELESLITKRGIEDFTEVVLSLGSKTRMLADQNAHRRWIRQQFAEHIVSTEQAKQVIQRHARQLETDFAQIDNDLLVAVGADVALDPTKLDIKPVDVSVIDRHVDALMGNVYRSIDQALAKSVSTFFFGAAGFEAGRRLSRQVMADDSGQVSLLGEAISWGIGLVAEETTRSISDELLQTRQQIDDSVRQSTQRFVQLTAGRTAETLGRSALKTHQLAVFDAVINALGVERAWAAKHYQ